MNDKSEQRLTYSNQMEFKSWARKNGLTQKNGARYYFDSIFAVHDNGMTSQDTIRGVIANGSLTWGEALFKLKLHFGIGVSLAE